MPLWIYNWPDWLIGMVTVGGCVALAAGGHALRRRWCGLRLPRGEDAMLLGIGLLLGTLSLVLLALCGFAGLDAANRTERMVQQEAGAIGGLGRSLAVMAPEESRLAREQLRAYTRSVIFKEWPAMQAGHSSLTTWDAFDTLFRSLSGIQPTNASERALMPEVWQSTLQLLQLRQARLQAAQPAVPAALWAVTTASTGLTLGLLTLLPAHRRGQMVLMLSSGLLGLGLSVAIALDRPFCRSSCPAADPFETALQRMERWDLQTTRSRSPP
ncbi:bestrophin-like domain [Roseateles terrae]|uniref:DUF4239 domain-containing protein n=1 Tax=Roseateles terrae TaxID=431060 RepID=A0ABR6GM60_9BURK|nr:DUF4239 domain-containing protein [Roseateles terrae]MBB3193196.1 hypothetical protein [Roseateles terrae]OWQ89586.1 hypothetical protein CDN98_03415 [Roseateles terrae]